MAESRQEIDLTKRGELLKQAQAIMLNDYAILPTRFPNETILVREYVKGFVPMRASSTDALHVDRRRRPGDAGRMITRRQFARNAAAFAALAAAGAAPALAQASGYTILRRGNQNEPQYLDPNKATGSWETNIIGDLFLGLTTEDADARPIPGAAESWTTSPDGLVWTFKLRAGAAWSDGVPVTADDFVFSMRRVLDPATAAEYASILYVIKNAAPANAGTVPLDQVGVRAIDPQTLELTLENPAAYLLELLMHTTSFPVPRHVVEAAGNGWTAPARWCRTGLTCWRTGSPMR